jgi:hypothetical protein
MACFEFSLLTVFVNNLKSPSTLADAFGQLPACFLPFIQPSTLVCIHLLTQPSWLICIKIHFRHRSDDIP